MFWYWSIFKECNVIPVTQFECCITETDVCIFISGCGCDNITELRKHNMDLGKQEQ